MLFHCWSQKNISFLFFLKINLKIKKVGKYFYNPCTKGRNIFYGGKCLARIDNKNLNIENKVFNFHFVEYEILVKMNSHEKLLAQTSSKELRYVWKTICDLWPIKWSIFIGNIQSFLLYIFAQNIFMTNGNKFFVLFRLTCSPFSRLKILFWFRLTCTPGLGFIEWEEKRVFNQDILIFKKNVKNAVIKFIF